MMRGMDRFPPRLRLAGNAALVCLFATAGVAAPVAAQTGASSLPAPLPLAEYQRLAEDCRLVADNKGDAATLKPRLQAVKAVQLPSGAIVTVDTAPLVAALTRASGPTPNSKKSAATEASNARAQLRGFANAVSPGGPPATFADGDPQKQAAAIVAGREFREAAGGPEPKTWWDKFVASILRSIGRGLENFARWIAKLFGRAPRYNGPNPNLSGLGEVVLFILEAIVAVAAIAAVFFLTRFLIYRYNGSPVSRKRKIGDTALDLEDDIIDPLAAAHQMAAQGDLRSALRYVYIASLRRLEGAGALVLERNKTNWEYQRMLRGRNHAAYDTLLPATRLFDRVWYGRRQPSQNEYDAVVRAHDALPSTPSSSDASGGAANSSRDLVGTGSDNGKRGVS